MKNACRSQKKKRQRERERERNPRLKRAEKEKLKIEREEKKILTGNYERQSTGSEHRKSKTLRSR